jgi:hypothetical protein
VLIWEVMMPKPDVLVEFHDIKTNRVKRKTIGLNQLLSVGEHERAAETALYILSLWKGIRDPKVLQVWWPNGASWDHELGMRDAITD